MIFHKSRNNSKGKAEVFDPIRKKYVVLTPEEQVRQTFVQFLVEQRAVPASLIAIEAGLKVNGMQRRADVVVYNKNAKPMVLVECKAPQVKITQGVYDQAARYNLSFKVPFLVVTNGLTHYCSRIMFDTHRFEHLNDIPFFNELDEI